MAVEKRGDANESAISAAAAVVHDASTKAASIMSQRSSAAEHGSSMTPKKSSKTFVDDANASIDKDNDALEQSEQKIAGNLDLQVAVGDFLETIEVQLAIVFLIVLDVCCTALEIHLHGHQELTRLQGIIGASDAVGPIVAAPQSMLLSVVTRLVESFTGFTIFFFLIEMAVLIAAFRKRFFAHLGYVLDLSVITGTIGYEIYAQSKALRLLGVLRIWRVFRLVNTLLDRERRAHDLTKDVLEEEQLKALQLGVEKQAAEQSLKREYESRDGLEKLLQGYKDEADTLKEALNIAAEAVAEAMRDDKFNSQEQQQRASREEAQASGDVDDAVASPEYYDEASYYYYGGYEQEAEGGYEHSAYPEQEQPLLEAVSKFPEALAEVAEQRDAEKTEELVLDPRGSHESQGDADEFEDAVEQ